MNFLFPYMARWKAVNWSRYQQIFTRLAQSGHTVHVIQAPAHDIAETNFQEIDVELPVNLFLHEIRINRRFWDYKFPLNKLVKKGYYSFKSIKKVNQLIKEHDIDVLFLYNIPQYPLIKVNRCVKIFDFADDYIAMLRQELGQFSNRLAVKTGEALLNAMLEKSDIILSVSQSLLKRIDAKYRAKAYLLPNGVDLSETRFGSGSAIRAQFKNPVIGFIGSFEYFIDFDLIIKAAALLPEYTFLLVGGGRQFEQVQKLIKLKKLDNIILTGGVPHSEIVKYIDAMDICLNIFKKIPISHSACPIKLFEYLSMRKPVISTRLEEVVENVDDGFLFYADTASELTAEVKKILQDEKLVEKCIEKGYNITLRKYQWSAIADRLVEIIKENTR